MPPRKKLKLSPTQAETQSASPNPVTSIQSAKPETEYDPVSDPWTDEQETALLKGIIKWKPVGMHKHFRMLAISEYMRSQGYAPSDAEHTRIPGIWKKLGTLYNLAGLDEREDALIADVSDDTEEPQDLYCPFELPDEEFREMMFERRLAENGSSSPAASLREESRRASSVPDTDEARSSPGVARRGKAGRGRRRGRRQARRQAEARSRKGNEGDGDLEEAAANDEADGEDTNSVKEETDDEEADGTTGTSPAPRSTRAQRSRPGQKGRGGTGTATRKTGRRR